METNKFYCADALTEIKKLPDKSVDIIITDPPYGVSKRKSGEPYMIGDTSNILIPILPEFHRVLKDDGAIFIFSGNEKIFDFIHYFKMYFKMHNLIIWDKINPIYPQSKAHFSLQYEPIIYGSKGLHYLKNKKIGDIIKAKIIRGKARVHPTQKPVEVIKSILSCLKEDKKIILDPFMGSGTTLVACKEMGLEYIGWELNKDYVEMAKKRMEQATLDDANVATGEGGKND